MHTSTNKKTKVLMAMSGGVDSSVAALLLVQAGYDVTGVFMKNWTPDDRDDAAVCQWKEDFKDAQKVATKIGIPLVLVDFEHKYREKVFSYMVQEYQAARTPNPDVMCNKEIKFGVLFSYMQEHGFDMIATGHYAQVLSRDGQFYLAKGVDDNKDQSYFLHQLSGDQLAQVLFPIGSYTKPEIRRLAKENAIPTAQKKDSQGICFVGKVGMKDFLADEIKPHKGEVITVDGEIVGEHIGVEYYTIGQRRGIGVGGGKPYFVVERDLENNRLVVTTDKADSRLYHQTIAGESFHWINGRPIGKMIKCKGKIRYRQTDQSLTLEIKDGGIWEAHFEEPQWAVSPGQSLVLYKDSVCLGGGIIESSY